MSIKVGTSYEVHIGRNLLDQVAATPTGKALIVHQPVMRDHAKQLAEAFEDAHLFEIPDAEEGKTLAVAEKAWDLLGSLGFSRSDLIVGLGGGATTDVAGFIASAWMRGIRVVQVPTTLLAMVDAAVGGKTGINTAAGKNLVGAFHEPAAVYVDLAFLDTLPREELVSGSAEIIKTGFIADEEILRIYESGEDKLPELIERSIAVKARVVAADLKESSLREILNYGHTFGHAVELAENYQWRHGNAVAVGMSFIAHLSHRKGLIDADLLQRHLSIITAAGLPTRYDGDFDELYDGMTRDKKNRGGGIRFVAITAVGETTRLEGVTKEEMRAAFEEMNR
ncbi:3-dehydroquinate synthase [Corynebacterium hindlerae]|uniref:3-dehydroquinate synthase n=1 Tax=Corynebacterium hindlerae TaxID=699041 RepID=A0A7G5FFK8_9CORY|nr:3-dehydroquinate synthase [Corynebacterium hindlerae]